MRSRFLRRAAGFFILAMLVGVGLITVLAWALSGLMTAVFGGGGAPFVSLVVFLALVAVAVLGRVFRRAAMPVGDLVEAAGRVESGELGVTVTESGPPEVRSLARAFNAMSRSLAVTNDERRRLLADVSHELRTPLAVIQGTVEGMIDGIYETTPDRLEPVLEEVRVLERLVDDLRTLSLADAGQLALDREPVDLAALAREVVVAFGDRAARDGVELVAPDAASRVEASIDPVRIRQVIGNLVANALRATPRGGSVHVGLDVEPGRAILTVSDTGSGMDGELAARAFERFSRAPGSPGSGLGLPIVRELVRAHGGEVELASAPGTGSTVTVRLPV
jgi:two-component system sensor histidine kinase BaeS